MRNFLGALKDAQSIWAAAVQFGLGPSISGGLVAACLWVAGVLEGLPKTVTALIALIAFVCGAMLFNMGLLAWKNWGQHANYEDWDSVEILELQQAAQLWVGRAVTTGGLNEAAYAKLRMFKEKITLSKMEVHDMNGSSPNLNTSVTRKSLMTLAEEIGERPQFLFKDAR